MSHERASKLRSCLRCPLNCGSRFIELTVDRRPSTGWLFAKVQSVRTNIRAYRIGLRTPSRNKRGPNMLVSRCTMKACPWSLKRNPLQAPNTSSLVILSLLDLGRNTVAVRWLVITNSVERWDCPMQLIKLLDIGPAKSLWALKANSTHERSCEMSKP